MPRVILGILGMLGGFPLLAHAAVADYLGKPVALVRLELQGRATTDSALLQVIETRVGEPLSMLQVRESVTHLFSLGRFDDVRVDATMEPTGVVLRYDLTPIRLVSKIVFAGPLSHPGIETSELRRAVTDRYGTTPPFGRVVELSRVISDVLRQRGYRRADVRPQVAPSGQSAKAILQFTIDPGPRTLISTIEIAGAPAEPREDLLDRLGIAVGAPYQPAALDERIMRYIDARRSRGYYEAQLTPAVRFEDDERVAHLTLVVVPGPHVRVVFAGDLLRADTQKELVPVEREGSVDEDLLEDSSNRIEEYLREQGYRDATAPHMRAESGGELLITFTVHKGPQYRTERVEISGNPSIPLAEFRLGLRLRDGLPFSAANLDADVATIESVYRRRGFAGVKVQSGVEPGPLVPGAADVPVLVRIVVDEGVRTLVGQVRIEGNASIPEATLRAALGLQPGVPYFDAQLRADSDAIQLQYVNRGFQAVTVEAQPRFTPDRTEANPVFLVREGPRIFVDHVLIAGNIRTGAETIERELQVKPGDPLSPSAIQESQRRLAGLGLFRRAQITELGHGNETTRDLLVTVEESPPTTIGYGGGVEGRLRVVSRAQDGGSASEKFEIAPRAFVEIGRRNLFGKNRSVNLSTSISVHPKEASFSLDQLSTSTGGYGFTEYRVVGAFREPRIFNTTMDGLVTGTLEQQIRSSFDFARRSATAQLARRLTPILSMSGAYQLQHTRLFDIRAEQSLIDRLFTQVRLSSFATSVIYDTRDDAVDPGAGQYVSLNGQLAARRIGSEVGFVKSFFTAQAFRALPRTNRIVLAGSARLGLAAGFRRDVVRVDENGNVVPGPDGNPIVESVIQDLPEPERFFAGGDTTVRGFALDTLGHADTVKNGFPIGGNALVIFNAEVRAPLRGGLGVVGFVDTGNVFAHAVDIDLTALRSAVGFGLRYKSPVGPIRVDLGFKVNRRPGEGLTAWFISFGQAF
jgi:outer membrane protein assembly complex protein YaeT